MISTAEKAVHNLAKMIVQNTDNKHLFDKMDFTLGESAFIEKYGPLLTKKHSALLSGAVGDEVAAQVWATRQKVSKE